MNKLASQKIDALDYILDGDLEKISSLMPSLSDSAKSCVILDLEETEKRAEDEFALIISHKVGGEMRKFAHHDAGNTELSSVLLDSVKDTLPDELVKIAATNLKAASDKFGCPFPQDLQKIAGEERVDPKLDLESINSVEYTEKISSATNTGDYALPEQYKYPLSTRTETIQARDYFEKYAHEMDPMDAVTFVTNLTRACDNFDVDKDYFQIEKFASLNPETTSKIAAEKVGKRLYYLKEDGKEEYKKFASSLTEKTASEAVNELSELDKKHRLDRFWGGRIDNPADTIFMSKNAGGGVTLEDLRSLDKGTLTGLVGSDAVGDLLGDEGLEVFETLPRPIKRELESLLNER